MIDTPEIVTTQRIEVAKIYQVVPSNQIQTIMGKTLKELKSSIEAQGKTITGPWFTHHLKPPAAEFDFEICFPVSGTIEPHGRMQRGEWPAMTVARTIYRGGYEGLPSAWAEFSRWIKSQRYAVEADIWERYLIGPESGNDPERWQTELNRPLSVKRPDLEPAIPDRQVSVAGNPPGHADVAGCDHSLFWLC